MNKLNLLLSICLLSISIPAVQAMQKDEDYEEFQKSGHATIREGAVIKNETGHTIKVRLLLEDQCKFATGFKHGETEAIVTATKIYSWPLQSKHTLEITYEESNAIKSCVWIKVDRSFTTHVLHHKDDQITPSTIAYLR